MELLKPSKKIALIQNERRISYEQLLDTGRRFGGRLRREGVSTGKYVLVFTPLSIELYVAMIGAWSIGAVPIFIDFSRGAKFVNDSIVRLRPDIMVCDNVTRIMRHMYPKMRKLKTLVVKRSNESVCIDKLKPEHPAILTLTSGTTGVPKVAIRTHGFLAKQYQVLKRHIDFDEAHIDLGTLPVFTLASLATNMTTLLPYNNYTSKINTARLAAKMEREGVTRVVCSPALIGSLLKHNNLPSLKSVYLGGAPVYPSILETINKAVDLHIVYGSTEAEPISSIRWADVNTEDREKIVGGEGLLVGNVIPEIECKIGGDNEILVSGETVLKGYLDGIGDNENKIRDGEKIWHKTGDAGFIDERGRLWLLGRIGQVIRGINGVCYPFCIECILDAHFGIRGAVFASSGEQVIVVIEKGSANPEDVLSALGSWHVARVIEVKKLPMDKRHGAKIDYARLEKIIER